MLTLDSNKSKNTNSGNFSEYAILKLNPPNNDCCEPKGDKDGSNIALFTNDSPYE